MINRNKLVTFLESTPRKYLIEKDKIISSPSEILKMDLEYVDIWQSNFVELCKSKFEIDKDSFLFRYNISPQPISILTTEIENISILDLYKPYYSFCIDFKEFSINDNLIDFIFDLLDSSGERFTLKKYGFIKSFISLQDLAERAITHGSYAFYIGFLQDLGKSYNINFVQTRGIFDIDTAFKVIEKKELNSNVELDIHSQSANTETILNLPYQPKNSFDISLIEPYINVPDNELFVKAIDSLYSIVSNNKLDNIKEHKLQIRYTIHLLIKNGWIKSSVGSKKRYIESFNKFFGFETNNNDYEQFCFPEIRDFVNTDNNMKFRLVYENLKKANNNKNK